MEQIAQFLDFAVEESRDARAVAERVASILSSPGCKRIAVSGGSTPPRIFRELADLGIGWNGAWVCPTDERQVDPHHPASNVGMLRAQIGNQGANIVALKAGVRTAPFDLVWVGMGDDGHVASLFPNMTTGENHTFPCVLEVVPIPLPREAPFARLTLNLAALVATRQILLVVSGAAKRRLIDRVLVDQPDLPVTRLLRAARCPVSIYALD